MKLLLKKLVIISQGKPAVSRFKAEYAGFMVRSFIKAALVSSNPIMIF